MTNRGGKSSKYVYVHFHEQKTFVRRETRDSLRNLSLSRTFQIHGNRFVVSVLLSFGPQHQYHVDLTGVKVMALCPSATDSKLLEDVGKQLLWPRYVDAWLRDVASSVPQR